MRVWHGRAHPLGATLGRPRRQRRGLLRAGHQHRFVPVRLGGGDAGKRTAAAAGADRTGLARLFPGCAAGAAVRVARRRALRPPPRSALQCQQAVVRPLRQSGRPGPGPLRCPVRIPVRQSAAGPDLRHPGQRGPRAAGGGHRRRLHLGNRHAAAACPRRHRHLRAACQGLHDAPPRRPRGPARHLCRAGLPGRGRAPHRAGRQCGGIAAGALPGQRALSWSKTG